MSGIGPNLPDVYLVRGKVTWEDLNWIPESMVRPNRKLIATGRSGQRLYFLWIAGPLAQKEFFLHLFRIEVSREVI